MTIFFKKYLELNYKSDLLMYMYLDKKIANKYDTTMPVIQCTQCGQYSLLNSKNMQVCNCNTLLVYENQLQPQSNLLTDCKMCEQIAIKNNY
jgi:hypothetical protein